ncbi:molybdate ABC transporter permease subunit [Candidatus Methylospira mobilis]|uniref:Molybdenum transport system permease n=1 Tax=Candidatus Methylospira mobilis TaxID=1808979 RepID=A0A5Q0BE37_9GAMM|nr:molybdate ABC transporter permease subunit [Candidatus Methylospira mobilis]QFY42080.1 molybdate ABC transporter permease subunit [Candidatus Methylospira mobilis]WNV03088.1 molybdate ABC transporter permease subunit [Candidatus Methylospira mobilis]
MPDFLSPEELSALLLSIKVSIWATLMSAPLAIFTGWLLARKNFPGKGVFDALIHLPLVLPPVVPGYLLLLLFGRNGPLGRALDGCCGITLGFSWKGAALASALMAFPLMVRSVRLSVSLIDIRLESAARTLGASALSVFFAITLPMAMPGIVSGLVLAFSRSLGEFGATITFVGNIAGETRTLPLAIYTASQIPDGDMQAMRLIALSLIVALAALVGSEQLSRRMERKLGLGAVDNAGA